MEEQIKQHLTYIEDKMEGLLKGMSAEQQIIEIGKAVARIEVKVEIHNNYEERIRDLEQDSNKFKGGGNILWMVITIIVALIVKLL